MTYFTSDTHFGHKNIISFSQRPFQSVEEMDEAMIDRWNEVVKPGDDVFHLGDFMFYRKEDEQRKIIDRLNGRINFLPGNHDDDLVYTSRFKFLDPIHWMKYNHQSLILCHYPLLEWDKAFRGSIHLHGHCHNQWAQTPFRRLDIGVDGHDFRPWHIDEIIEWAKDRPPLDSTIYWQTCPDNN